MKDEDFLKLLMQSDKVVVRDAEILKLVKLDAFLAYLKALGWERKNGHDSPRMICIVNPLFTSGSSKKLAEFFLPAGDDFADWASRVHDSIETFSSLHKKRPLQMLKELIDASGSLESSLHAKREIARANGLKIFNGRGWDQYRHAYVCAKSRAEACRLLHAVGHGGASDSELKNFWHEGAWGNAMAAIDPEKGVWVTAGKGEAIKRLC